MFPQTQRGTFAQAQDSALARFMRQTFNYMTGGVALSGLVAYLTFHIPALMAFAVTPAAQIIFLVIWFGLGLFFHKLAERLSPAGALGAFALFSAATGFGLVPIALMYTGADITLAFIAAAAVFAGASAYGYMTKRSLAGLGAFLAVGGIALMIMALVLIGMSFFGGVSQGISILFSLLVVPFVTIAIAFKVNMLREGYMQIANGSEADQARMSITMALGFYTDFVVLFLHLLRLISALNNNR